MSVRPLFSSNSQLKVRRKFALIKANQLQLLKTTHTKKIKILEFLLLYECPLGKLSIVFITLLVQFVCF